MDKAIAGKDTEYDAAVAVNEAALEKSGHWGVPTFAFQGEAFFGQDRIDMCLWRMKKAGLKPRAA